MSNAIACVCGRRPYAAFQWNMKNYLEARREELRKRGDKGFTLMEMLIVVAIIAVLIAIAIPVFTTQLEKSRDAVSVSNMRSAYAQAQAAIVTYTDAVNGVPQGDVTITKTTDGYTAEVGNVAIKSQTADDWSGVAVELPWWDDTATPADTGANTDGALTFTYDNNFKITAVAFN